MKITPTNKWSYSQDEEIWDNDYEYSKEDAIEAGKEWYLGESFKVGRMYDVKFTEEQCEWFNLAEKAIDVMNDALEDEVGEVAEYWTNQITREDEEDLDKRIGKAIMEWIEERIGQPNVFLVNDLETVTEDKVNGSY